MTTSDIYPSPGPGEECKTSKTMVVLCLKIQGENKQQAQGKTDCQQVLRHPDKSALVSEYSIAAGPLQHSDIFAVTDTLTVSGIWQVGQLISIMFDVL